MFLGPVHLAIDSFKKSMVWQILFHIKFESVYQGHEYCRYTLNDIQ